MNGSASADDLSLYETDHAAWCRRAAPRIAAVLAATDDEARLLDSWSMLKPATKQAVWDCLDQALRSRIKALCKARPPPSESTEIRPDGA